MAPSGTAPPLMPLASVMMSGTTSQCSQANQRPVRPKPGHHLVEDEQDAVPVADLADGGEVARRRHEHAVGAGDGLEDHRGDGLRALVLQDLLQVRTAGGDGAVAGVTGGRVDA